MVRFCDLAGGDVDRDCGDRREFVFGGGAGGGVWDSVWVGEFVFV